MKKAFYYIPLACAALLGFSSCEKYLDVTSETQKQATQSFKNIADLRGATAFLYCRPWYTTNTSVREITEARAGNLYVDGVTGELITTALFSEVANYNNIANSWASLYLVITQADYIINDYVKTAIENGVNESEAKACEAEARFMRAAAYWYLANLWHDVPIIDDPRNHTLNPLTPPHRFEDVVQYAINDLIFASEYLKDADTKGRVTKDSARGMLARIYLMAANYAMGNHFSNDYISRNNAGSNSGLADNYFEQVKKLCQQVVEGGYYSMLPDFEQLWRTQNNNNSETLFGIQFIPGITEWGYTSPLNDLAYNRELTGNLNGGGTIFVSYDMLKSFVDDGAVARMRGSVAVPGQNYNYIGTHLSAGSWTVPSGKTKVNLKKFVVGSSKDTDGAAVQGNTGLVSPMLRMSEIYLMYAEAALGKQQQTNDAVALAYFNKVRERAFSKNIQNFVPATTITRDNLFTERRLEFFYETIYWTDLKRRSFYDMDWVLNFLNNKLKDSDAETPFTNYASWAYTYDPLLYPTGKGWTNSPRAQSGYKPQAVVHNLPAGSYVHAVGATSNIWCLPYPSADVTTDPELTSAPINYDFN
ncbi:RagB/SusD family nutrient uptake outer membrane protein [Sphingobacterium sp. PCS056]|uniref:RagB/SusD family nutrient uptake outer membrane protein n=1 Tax=Sphingobacterium sp. PCS056 TaxID=2931400 RepID=UPI00200DFF5E|nr:RagB/SusD family nutrient uptake outer membrane protein [Sphingobacterium sp. PCS056]UPZ36315.1 RagB/SusD family nutrient uptake outer membrane protein [Sphingobacterium sp. PCS056]